MGAYVPGGACSGSKNNKALWDMSAKSQAKRTPEVLLMLCESVFLWLHPGFMSFSHRSTRTLSPGLESGSTWDIQDGRCTQSHSIITDNIRWEICSDHKINVWHHVMCKMDRHRWSSTFVVVDKDYFAPRCMKTARWLQISENCKKRWTVAIQHGHRVLHLLDASTSARTSPNGIWRSLMV